MNARSTRVGRAWLLALAWTSVTLGVVAAEPDAREILERVQTYLAQREESLAAVVAEERYTQILHHASRYRDRQHGSSVSRKLVSDVLLLRAPAENVWLSFRDVASVDGLALRDRQRRFDELFVRPAARLLADARRIADEGARFNLGQLTRNINTPTAGVVFLHSPYAERTRWRRGRNARLDGAPAWVLSFEQREPPFAVRRADGRPQPASGRVWLEPESGRILQIEFSITDRTTRARVLTRFGNVLGIDAWVPVRMTETYQLGDIERISGEANYTNHRIFQPARGSFVISDW